MEKLINVKNENEKLLVSARELHEKLQIKTKFTDWMKRNLAYGFMENEDYNILKIENLENTGFDGKGTPKQDYIISLDMAKEICMIQKSEIGRKFRLYFIQCEKYIIESGQQEAFKNFRVTGKVVRRDLTNTIQNELNPSCSYVFSNYTNLIYKTLFGKSTKQLKEEKGLIKKDNLRDYLTPEELQQLTEIEDRVRSFIITLKAMGIGEKEIYYKVKEII